MYVFRAELEATYAKGLSKLSSKLTKACAKDQGDCQPYINFAFISLVIIHSKNDNYNTGRYSDFDARFFFSENFIIY